MNEFKLRRGLKNVFVAEVTNDDNGTTGYTTGTPYHLIPAGTMTRTTSNDKANTWFDNVVYATVGTEGATEISITGASLRVNDIAKLLGKTVDSSTNAVIDDGKYHEKYFAIGGECEGLDGTIERFWFLKGSFSCPELDDKTIDDTTDANGMTLVYNAIQTVHSFTTGTAPAKFVVIDSTKTSIKSQQSWTAQVVTPDNVSTICDKVT